MSFLEGLVALVPRVAVTQVVAERDRPERNHDPR